MPQRDLSRKRGESLAKYVRRLGRAIFFQGEVTLDYDGGPYAAIRVDGHTQYAAWSASRPLEMLALTMESSAYALETAAPRFDLEEWNPARLSGRNALPSDRPLRFRRRVPFQDLGVEIEITIHSDLTVDATHVDGMQLAVGRFSAGHVTWIHASAELGTIASDMIASDVHDILDLFRSGLLSAESWTTRPDARAELTRQRYDERNRAESDERDRLFDDEADEQLVRQLLLAQAGSDDATRHE